MGSTQMCFLRTCSQSCTLFPHVGTRRSHLRTTKEVSHPSAGGERPAALWRGEDVACRQGLCDSLVPSVNSPTPPSQPSCAASGPARSSSYAPFLSIREREERKTKVNEAASSLFPFLFSSLHPCGLIPDADGTFSFSGQRSCQEWCASQARVLTSLSLHSSGGEVI